MTQVSLRRITFQKDIRRQQLENIFQRMRLTMMNPIQLRPTHTIKDPISQLTALHNQLAQAREKQKYEQLINYKKEKYPADWFHQFMTRDVGYSLLAMATSILADYYYYADRKMPSLDTLRCIIDCFRDAENQILGNCILIIENILHDYKELKETFLQTFNFVDLIVHKINQYRNHKDLLKKLLKIVYHLLNLSKPHPNYEQLYDPLATFIASSDQSTPHSRQINLSAVYSFHLLAKLLPKSPKLLKHLIQQKLLEQLIQLLQKPNYAERRFTFIIFDLIEICRENFSDKHVIQVIMPLILGLRNLEFQYGTRSSIYTAEKTKIKAYSYILYLATHHLESTHQIFAQTNYELMKSFLSELAKEESPKVAEVLTKIVCHLSMCFGQDHQAINFIKEQIIRTIQLNDYKYEIERYFEDYFAHFDSCIDIEL